MKILLADDTPTVLRLASFVLEQRGHDVKTLTDGDEVIRWLEEALPLPDLIITDNNMARVSGLEVLRFLRANDRFKNLPVIVYTTNDLVEFKTEVESLGGMLVNKMAKELLAAVDAIAATLAKEKE